ncbi:MAG: flagellar hook-length control protein FliK [Congregibacter sp.]
MEELQLALTTARVDQRNFGLWINNWQIGQTLNALVTSQLPTGELVLRVGGQQITATADIPIQRGATLMLEVKSLQPIPTLKVLNPTPNPASVTVGGTLQLLPQSGSSVSSVPVANVLQSLQSLQAMQSPQTAGVAVSSQAGAAIQPAPTAQPAASAPVATAAGTAPVSNVGASLPPAIAASIDQLLRQVSRPERLTQAPALAKAIGDSGVFLEAELNAVQQGRPANVNEDVKAGLFRLLSRVDGMLAKVEALTLNAANVEAILELRKEIEAGLGRITLQQLNSQPADPQTISRNWQFELPVQLAGSFHGVFVSIERDGHGQNNASGAEAEDEVWKVKLHLAPEGLGGVEASLQLQDERVALRFAAERAEVRALIDAGLPTLETALASHGLSLAATSAAVISSRTAGEPNETEQSASALDVRA